MHLPRLIVLDLDGTSARYEPRFELDPVVAETLREIRARWPQVRWALNSDRFEGEMIRLAEYLPVADRPEALMSCQHLLYLRTSQGGYREHLAWNAAQRKRHGELWQRIYPKFDDWQREIRRQYPVHESFVCHRYFAFRVTPDRLPCLRRHVRALIQPWGTASVSGNHEWVFVVHGDFSKGRLLRLYAAEAGIAHKDILAIGDGYNDLSMLDRSIAGTCGCPGDAAPEVIAAVKDAAGIIANSPGPTGTAEILRHLYLD